MKYRMAIAVLALVNALVATLPAPLQDSAGWVRWPATRAAAARWRSSASTAGSLGVDVALIGVVGYAFLFVCALVALQPSLVDARRMSVGAFLLIVPAVLFTWRLKYGEWVVLKTFCPWCFISFVSIHACLDAGDPGPAPAAATVPAPDKEPATLPLAA